jgi:hypothetical protein
MTINEAARMTPEQIARVREKESMVSTLDQILDLLEDSPPRRFLRRQTETTLIFACGLLREDILTAAGERVR